MLALDPAGLERFVALCRRERCPHAVIGEVAGDGRLVVDDAQVRRARRRHADRGPAGTSAAHAEQRDAPPATRRRLRRRHPSSRATPSSGSCACRPSRTRVSWSPSATAASGGMISRDPLVGPWQVPVSDVAVTTSGLSGSTGEAMALGERPFVALLDAPASGRIAVGEAITNIAAADVRALGDVKLSANWMAACGDPAEDADLYDTVRALGEALCPALGIAIPVGKDSLSMRTSWRDATGVARGHVATLARDHGLCAGRRRAADADPGARRRRGTDGPHPGRPRRRARPRRRVLLRAGLRADRRPAARRRRPRTACIVLRRHPRVARCRDSCSLTTTARTAGSRSRCSRWPSQVAPRSTWNSARSNGPCRPVCGGARRRAAGARRGPRPHRGRARAPRARAVRAHGSARPRPGDRIRIAAAGRVLVDENRRALHAAWSETTWRMQKLRDEPSCADEERDARLDPDDPGLAWRLTYDADQDVAAPFIASGRRPRVAILREQGVNSQVEMAAAFDRAGFTAVDVHMTDLIDRGATLEGYPGPRRLRWFQLRRRTGRGRGLGEVDPLQPARARHLRGLVREDGPVHARRLQRMPDAGRARGTHSRRRALAALPAQPFRAVRGSAVDGRGRGRRTPSSSPGWRARSCRSRSRTGRAAPCSRARPTTTAARAQVTLRFVDNGGRIAERYPANPNGSPDGIAGLASSDGRVTILMPHPERVFRTVQNSWYPATAGEDSGWMRMFRNARVWVG